jgi:glutamine amidotransferase-like uncharacterized protein
MTSKKTIICGLVVILLFLSISLKAGNVSKTDRIANVLIYSGAGAWDDGVIAFEKFLEFKDLTWFECDSSYIEDNSLIGGFDVIHFPGGNSGAYINNINSAGLQNIRDFVSAGGGYIGICAGGYFACDRVDWEGSTYDHPLDLFDGVGYGAIDEITPWPNYAMTTININLSNPINQYEPSTEYVLYYGGAAYYPNEGQEMNIIATYDSFNDDAAWINFNYGSGRVVLMGPHPEIEEDSTRDGVSFGDNMEDLGTDWNLMWTCMDWLVCLPISEPPDPLPPETPIISGPKRARTGAEIEYKIKTVDPESEELYFWVEWGDESVEEWVGPYYSGEEVNIKHSWSEGGTYSIEAKAKDVNGLESGWGTLEVQMSRIKALNNPLLRFLKQHLNLFPIIRYLLGLESTLSILLQK